MIIGAGIEPKLLVLAIELCHFKKNVSALEECFEHGAPFCSYLYPQFPEECVMHGRLCMVFAKETTRTLP